MSRSSHHRDPDAFLAALRPHYDDALRYSRALCATWSPDEAEDVFQTALLRALEKHHALREPSQFRSWFFRILTRTFYSAVRWHTVRQVLPLPTDAEAGSLGLYAEEPDPGATADTLAVLGRLGAKERAALLLYELAGFSIDEVAKIQGDRSASAVKSRLSRARSRARDIAESIGAAPEGRPLHVIV
ncbi:MAG: RNA polymerase sigma factor [Bacteroidota bacterium]